MVDGNTFYARLYLKLAPLAVLDPPCLGDIFLRAESTYQLLLHGTFDEK